MRAAAISRAQILRCELKSRRKSRNFAESVPHSSRNFARVCRRARANLDHGTPGHLWRELTGRSACVVAKKLTARRRFRENLREKQRANLTDFRDFRFNFRFVLRKSNARDRRYARGAP